MQEKSDDKKSTWVDIVIGLINIVKTALWPAIVLGIYISMYHPLQVIMERIPDVIGRAEVITLGELNIKLNKELAIEASYGVREAVKGLSSKVAVRLIQLKGEGKDGLCSFNLYDTSSPIDFATDDELKERKLVNITRRIGRTLTMGKKMADCYNIDMTSLGKETQLFIIKTLATALTLKSDGSS